MLFAHDTESALVAAAALVNTTTGPYDGLATPSDLVAFLDVQRFTGRRDGTAAELAEVQALRNELRRLWLTGDNTVVPAVNALLVRTGARPRLTRHDGWDWHLHVTDPQAPLVDRLGAEAAMALVDIVRGGHLHRLRTCERPGCTGVLIDLSRNCSRRFCDTGCANRVHVAAHRARRRAV